MLVSDAAKRKAPKGAKLPFPAALKSKGSAPAEAEKGGGE